MFPGAFPHRPPISPWDDDFPGPVGKAGKGEWRWYSFFVGCVLAFLSLEGEQWEQLAWLHFDSFPAGTKHVLLLKACVEHAQKWAGQWVDSESDTFLFVICLRDRRLLRREENHLSTYCVPTFICRNIFKPHCCSKIRRFPFLPPFFPSFLPLTGSHTARCACAAL